MSLKFLASLVAAFVVLVPYSARAGESGAPIPVLSFEGTSCGAWMQSQKYPATREVYLYWFRGFVSGYNFGSETQQVPLSNA